MAIVFPASPNTNDTFTAGSITYKWDGAKWIGLGVTPADRLVEGSNSLELDASNDLVYTAPGTLKVNSADASGYIAEFNQTNASNSGQILLNSPTDGNSRPSLMDFARGGNVKFSVGMGYNDGNNGFLISAGGSLASNITNAVFRITPDGKTGIGNYAANGTETPTSLLHVATNWDNGDVPMVHFVGANNEAPQSGTQNISFQISDENSNVLHKVWNTGGGNNDFGNVNYSGNMGVGSIFTPGATLHVRDSDSTTMGVAQAKISKGIGSGAAPETITRENLYLHLGGSEWGSSANGTYLIGFGYTNGETGTGIPAYVGYNEDTTSGYTNGSLVFGTRPNTLGDNAGRERMRITEKGVRQYPCANDASHAYQGIYQQLSGKKQLVGSGNFTDIVEHGHSCSYILQYYLLENDNNSLGGGPGTAYLHVRYGSTGYSNHVHTVGGMNGGSLSSPEIAYVNAGSKLTFRATWSGSNPVFIYWHLSGCGNTKLNAL